MEVEVGDAVGLFEDRLGVWVGVTVLVDVGVGFWVGGLVGVWAGLVVGV